MINIENIKDIESFWGEFDNFIEDSKKLVRNLEGLKSKIELSKKGEGYSMKFIDCPKQYKHSLFLLASDVMRMGNVYMHDALTPRYAQQDVEEEINIVRKEIKENELLYLSTLLNKGVDAFIDTLNFVHQKQELIYSLKHINFADGNYILDDKIWDKKNSVFKDEKNTCYFQFQTIYKELLG